MDKKYLIFVAILLAVFCLLAFLFNFYIDYTIENENMGFLIFIVVIGVTAAITHALTKNKYNELATYAAHLSGGHKINGVCLKNEEGIARIYFYIKTDDKYNAIVPIDNPKHYTWIEMKNSHKKTQKYITLLSDLNYISSFNCKIREGEFEFIDSYSWEYFGDQHINY